MKRITFSMFLLLRCSISFSQTTEEQDKGQKCKTKWKYYQLKHVTDGDVLYHQKALVWCGIFSTASVTLIRTEKGDTIRVLQMCNTETVFRKGTKVTVVPEGDKTWRVDLVPYDPQGCMIMEVCFGKITSD